MNRVSDLAAEAAENSIWATPPVRDQPCITLIRWSVMETETGERYLVGHNLADREGRVSTGILSFDPNTLTATTESGRFYRLVGPSGHDPDGNWVWTQWARSRQLQGRDVTSEYKVIESDTARHKEETEDD